VSGLQAQAAAKGDSVTFLFAGGQGQFIGRLAANRATLGGFWIQPPGTVNQNAYAQPVTLRQETDASWHGTLDPLEDRFSLYLLIQEEKDGSLNARFRNPQFNMRGAPSFRVTLAGDSLQFDAPSRPGTGFFAAYDSVNQRLRLNWMGMPLELTRRDRDHAVGLYARSPVSEYRYRPPTGGRDGWAVARGSEVGIDEAALTQMVRRIEDWDPAADSTNVVHGLLVARHGKLVLEEYFHGFDAARPHDLRSASKAFAGVLLGVAMARGVPIGPTTPVYSLFPGAHAHPDPQKQHITLAQLLTHSSGLACDDNDRNSPGNENTMQGQSTQPDWDSYMLDLPVQYPPGTHWAYCSGGINLAGGAIRTATSPWLPEYFDRYVAQPLGLRDYYLNLTPTGELYMGGGMYLRPRDFLKLGQTYLAGGVWNGRRVVSAAWVDTSTVPRIAGFAGGREGYAWHLFTIGAGEQSYREIEANGNGGQILMILPDLDVTILFTAGNYGTYDISRRARDELVPTILLPAIRR
jgi:CubicO group peptidase (beta-lactamase class C family)